MKGIVSSYSVLRNLMHDFTVLTGVPAGFSRGAYQVRVLAGMLETVNKLFVMLCG